MATNVPITDRDGAKMNRLFALIALFFSINAIAAETPQQKLDRLVAENKCDQADNYVATVVKGSSLVYMQGWIEYFCRGNKPKGYALMKKSADLGNSAAKKSILELDRRARDKFESQCDHVYGLDASYSKYISEIKDVYGQQIEETRSDGTTAYLLGAGGTGNIGDTLSSSGRASMPYTERINRLAFERDSKIREIRHKQNQLRLENKQCFP